MVSPVSGKSAHAMAAFGWLCNVPIRFYVHEWGVDWSAGYVRQVLSPDAVSSHLG